MSAFPQGSRGFDHDTLVRFGRWLASLRGDRSQQEVQAGTGVHFSQVSRLELGRIDNPGLKDLVALGNYYGVSPNEIAARLGIWRGDTIPVNHDWREITAIYSRLPAPVAQKIVSACLAIFLAAEAALGGAA